MLLIALHFASCLSSLTLLIGKKLEGQICADTAPCHIAEACQWRKDQKNVRPACTSSWPDGPASSPPHIRKNPDVRGSRPLRGIWKMSGQAEQSWTVPLPRPTLSALSPDWFPRPLLSCIPPLDTSAGIWSPTSGEDTATSSTITTILGLCFIPQPFLEIRKQWWLTMSNSVAWKKCVCFLLEGFCAKFEKESQV